MALAVQKLSQAHDCTLNCQACPTLANALARMQQGMSKVSRITREQGQTALDTMVENLRGYKELLHGMDDLLLRREKAVAAINIESIQKRLQSNKTKLNEMNGRGSVQKDVDKLATTLDQDQREMVTQTRRLVFMRYCLWQEMRFFHRQKAVVGQIWSSWVHEQQRLSEQINQEWSALISVTQDMPIVF
jgi:hypothetical protein